MEPLDTILSPSSEDNNEKLSREDHQKVNKEANDKILKHDKICKFYTEHRCRFGKEGKDCKFKHPRIYKAYQKYGRDPGKGCSTFKKCGLYHPKICEGSGTQCIDPQCKNLHLKGTRRHALKEKPSLNLNIETVDPHTKKKDEIQPISAQETHRKIEEALVLSHAKQKRQEETNDVAAIKKNYKFFFRCATQLCIPLQLLWSASLLEGVIPDTTRSARITPLYKGGPRSMPKIYRPVALTSHVIKLLEKIVVKNIMNFLEHNTLTNRGQHGFRRGRSCLSQLLEHHTHLLESIEAGLNSDVIYLDFEKAFDKVDHGVLLHKMRNLGITVNIGRWVHAFLSNRTQVVTTDGCVSKQSSVVRGVPQGSVLGPILFLILISDIDQEVKTSKVTSIADDTRVSHSIKDKDDVIAL
ncbi:hypothetical protein Pcinc_000104 [Petrolisthes cinctipes]|uniref:Reverse transcriptase domain-containing protein n=1 Tax=Petrolisthes cinctipes TaxID=88211 RepID=A0AAE1L5K6_PETCI|nr:hypothetical protein Pcinc_000104 [Petrolisthes cinctipes]